MLLLQCAPVCFHVCICAGYVLIANNGTGMNGPELTVIVRAGAMELSVSRA